jgi:intracellular sulfur oxidation DsrE/DsrF family protein
MKLHLLYALTSALIVSTAASSTAASSDPRIAKVEKQRDSTLIALRQLRDSTYRATLHADSVTAEKEFYLKRAKAIAVYPVLHGGDFSGVMAVPNPTEIPDANAEYKLLFEVTQETPDSAVDKINPGLAEVARVINLHVQSGIPMKKIKPVIVVHAGAVSSIANNAYHQQHWKIDNPNLRLINSLDSLGARVIACGQALEYYGVPRAVLLPQVKVAVTAQVVLSSYGSKGYVIYKE